MMSNIADKGPLRTGYTTGACAAAAAKAAAFVLLRQMAVRQIDVRLPGGQPVTFAISRCTFDRNGASCSVIKDAGDDPDITDGAEIQAILRWTSEPGISITGGEGVGVVTKPGLEVAVGMPAINPVPRRMILQAVREATEGRLDGRGLSVTISVPAGEALARRTLNSRLGIRGGISILGSTGLVIPYSVNAYRACISQALDVALASGCREVVLTTGRRSERFAQRALALPDECFIQAGDFIGYSLKECARKGINKVTIWGMFGKMSKLAAGHLYTNVSDSAISINFLSELAAAGGVPEATLRSLREAVTANHFRKLLPPQYLGDFCNRLCQLAAAKCAGSVGGKVRVECVISDPEGVILGRSDARG